MALLVGVIAPPPVTAAPAAGTFAVTGSVVFEGRGGSTSGGFPCKFPDQTQSACEARFLNGSEIKSALSGESAEGVPFSLLLTTRVGTGTNGGGAKSSFTYSDDLGGAGGVCTQSQGAGDLYFDTAGRANEAFGSYHNSPNGVPSSIVGARGHLYFRWRAVGTVMTFIVINESIEVEVFSPSGNYFRTVMSAPVTTQGANGAGVFVPTSTSLTPVVACATNGEGTSPMNATVAWDFALNAGA
jgi:hypothetical protein